MSTPVSFVSWALPLAETRPAVVADRAAFDDFLRSLVKGLTAVEAHPSELFSPESLGKEAFACAHSLACQFDGRADLILERTSGVVDDIGSMLSTRGTTSPEGDLRLCYLFELVFYRGWAHARRGDVEESRRTWDVLRVFDAGTLPAMAARGLLNGRAKAEVEEAVILLNNGHYKSALPRIDAVLQSAWPDDVVVYLRALAVGQLAAVGLGQRAKLKSYLAREQRALETTASGCPGFRNARTRREIGALLAMESFDEAEALLTRGLADNAGQDNLLEALLRQLGVKLHLVRHDLEAAEAELAALEIFARGRELSSSILDLREQKAELALRRRAPERLGEEARELLAEALERSDARARMQAHMFLARWQLLSGRAAQARDAIAAALAVCEEEDYGPDAVECYFHAMGVAHATQDLKLFREAVGCAGKLARGLGLGTKAACFEYVLSLTSPARERSTLPLLELLRVPGVAREAFHLLDAYGFLKDTRFPVDRGGVASILDERQLREEVLRGQGAWDFPEAGCVLAVREDGRVEVAELAKGGLPRLFFEALLASSDGLSSEDVHALTSAAAYHSLRHASKVKTLVHRLRATLTPLGVTIAGPRDSGCGRYRIEGRGRIAVVGAPLA
jgi:hypothetical protein